MNICEVCNSRPMKEFVVVRNRNNPKHVAKALMCAFCFAEIQRQTLEPPPNVVDEPTTVEAVSQQEYDEIVVWYPGMEAAK